MASSRLRWLETAAAGAAVALMALVAIPVLPGSHGAAFGPRRDRDLRERLALLRGAVFRFAMDHRDPAGALRPGQEGADLVDQLTGRSRRDGTTAEAADGWEDRWLGPYLREIPQNPVNGLATIRVAAGGALEPVLDGTAGWVYVPRTGRVFADLPGVDPDGLPYGRY